MKFGTVPGISNALRAVSVVTAARCPPFRVCEAPGALTSAPQVSLHRCVSWGQTQKAASWETPAHGAVEMGREMGASCCHPAWVLGEEDLGAGRCWAGQLLVLLSLVTAALLSPLDLAGAQAPPGLDGEEPHVNVHADPHTVGGGCGSSGKAGRRERLMNHHSMVVPCWAFN